ncbi:antibiotic biosynthesis monooxygenase [Nostocoides sp. F2B08]|uniref:antibiotic biosynthesis monooxygenase n=1 Tax=Nostocoides sp. F2B08 TaxID=2653936 RepID=UPI00126310DB|nr:antibiotic biosynthesis monooxygenase [Tetrasphaera sp. F2B08]KAB7745064.1 antibiotic biosynthesis monooxygenase [Tetrasphaera sp. F2B08]
MIKRVWRGWTSVDNADEYEHLLNTTIVPGITARRIAGLRATEILREREPSGTEVQFVTIMTFDDWDGVREFAGGDGLGSVVPPQARALLSHFDEHSAHFDVVENHLAADREGGS